MVYFKFLKFSKALAYRQSLTNNVTLTITRRLCHHNLNIDEIKNDRTKQVLEKLLYNDVLWRKSMDYQKERRLRNNSKCETEPKAICLQYLVSEELKSNDETSRETETLNLEDEFLNSDYCHIPYEVTKSYLVKDVQINDEIKESIPEDVASLTPVDKVKPRPPNQWKDPTLDSTISRVDIADLLRYGTCNPSKPISNVPCGGCGALLHCIDEGMPGFLPQEIFCGKRQRNLKSELCQRCFFLKEFNIGLGVNVSPEEYPKLLSQIKNNKVLVILMIDILDFPCSVWPGISDIIGSNPVLIVANKVDLLIQENPDFERSMKEAILSSLLERDIPAENVIEILLTSGKSGYGLERLINCVNLKWNLKGDVYLMGSTNVGKSTLFNALIRSDLCREDAENVLKRATVSAWPGTTLKFLKFPMRRIHGTLLRDRISRLQKKALSKSLFIKTLKEKKLPTILPSEFNDSLERTQQRNRGITMKSEFESWSFQREEPPGLDSSDPKYQENKWLYDTPGVIQRDQITNLLTTSELLLILPNTTLLPRNFTLRPGDSIFIGGLARVDFTEGNDPVWFTVYASMEIPITVVRTENADEIYKVLLGTRLFRVPSGGQTRLSKWPSLEPKTFEVIGKYNDQASGDLVLSSAGWVAIYLPAAHQSKITAWTPEGRGIYLRNKTLIKTGHLYRGRRISKTPAYSVSINRPRKVKNFGW